MVSLELSEIHDYFEMDILSCLSMFSFLIKPENHCVFFPCTCVFCVLHGRRIRIPEDSKFSEGLVELIHRMLTTSPTYRASASEVLMCHSCSLSNCLCVYNQLHMTAQPAHVILIYQYYNYGSTLWGCQVPRVAAISVFAIQV